MGTNTITVTDETLSIDWFRVEGFKHYWPIHAPVLIDRVDRELVYSLSDKSFLKCDWKVFTLSNGGFFFVPLVNQLIPLSFLGGNYKPTVSPKLAGLIVSMEAFSYFKKSSYSILAEQGKKFEKLLCDYLDTLPEDDQEIVYCALF